MNYEKPIIVDAGTSEGIYLQSGDTDSTKCNSIYMKGVFQSPTNNSIVDGYKKGYGCMGCPAFAGTSCMFDSRPETMNWKSDFRPSWEINGKLPNEKGY